MRIIYYSELDGDFQIADDTIVFVGKFRDMRESPVLGPLDLVTKGKVDQDIADLTKEHDTDTMITDAKLPFFDGGDLRNSGPGKNDFQLNKRYFETNPVSLRSGFQPSFDKQGRVIAVRKMFRPIRGKINSIPKDAILTKFSWSNLIDNPGTMESFVRDIRGYVKKGENVDIPRESGRLAHKNPRINRRDMIMSVMDEIAKNGYPLEEYGRGTKKPKHFTKSLRKEGKVSRPNHYISTRSERSVWEEVTTEANFLDFKPVIQADTDKYNLLVWTPLLAVANGNLDIINIPDTEGSPYFDSKFVGKDSYRLTLDSNGDLASRDNPVKFIVKYVKETYRSASDKYLGFVGGRAHYDKGVIINTPETVLPVTTGKHFELVGDVAKGYKLVNVKYGSSVSELDIAPNFNIPLDIEGLHYRQGDGETSMTGLHEITEQFPVGETYGVGSRYAGAVAISSGVKPHLEFTIIPGMDPTVPMTKKPEGSATDITLDEPLTIDEVKVWQLPVFSEFDFGRTAPIGFRYLVNEDNQGVAIPVPNTYKRAIHFSNDDNTIVPDYTLVGESTRIPGTDNYYLEFYWYYLGKNSVVIAGQPEKVIVRKKVITVGSGIVLGGSDPKSALYKGHPFDVAVVGDYLYVLTRSGLYQAKLDGVVEDPNKFILKTPKITIVSGNIHNGDQEVLVESEPNTTVIVGRSLTDIDSLTTRFHIGETGKETYHFKGTEGFWYARYPNNLVWKNNILRYIAVDAKGSYSNPVTDFELSELTFTERGTASLKNDGSIFVMDSPTVLTVEFSIGSDNHMEIPHTPPTTETLLVGSNSILGRVAVNVYVRHWSASYRTSTNYVNVPDAIVRSAVLEDDDTLIVDASAYSTVVVDLKETYGEITKRFAEGTMGEIAGDTIEIRLSRSIHLDETLSVYCYGNPSYPSEVVEVEGTASKPVPR